MSVVVRSDTCAVISEWYSVIMKVWILTNCVSVDALWKL